jgi:hypothetical protein
MPGCIQVAAVAAAYSRMINATTRCNLCAHKLGKHAVGYSHLYVSELWTQIAEQGYLRPAVCRNVIVRRREHPRRSSGAYQVQLC